jgi:hypothetical protein
VLKSDVLGGVVTVVLGYGVVEGEAAVTVESSFFRREGTLIV